MPQSSVYGMYRNAKFKKALNENNNNNKTQPNQKQNEREKIIYKRCVCNNVQYI